MFARCAFRFVDVFNAKSAPILGSKKRPQKRAPPAPALKKDNEQLRRPPFWGPEAALRCILQTNELHLRCAAIAGGVFLQPLRLCGLVRRMMAGCTPRTSSNWGGPSTRPQIWSGFWTQFWGPPAQCVSPGVSAKLQNRSAASPAPPRRSAPIKLQTKAVWPNVRGVIFVARDTGIQGPYSATPPVRY